MPGEAAPATPLRSAQDGWGQGAEGPRGTRRRLWGHSHSKGSPVLRAPARSSSLPILALFPSSPILGSALPPVRAGWEARLPRGAANKLEKTRVWQTHSVASVGAAGLIMFSWRQQWPGVSQLACLASFCVVNTAGRCEDRGWGGAGGSPSQALTGSQVGQPSRRWLQLGT